MAGTETRIMPTYISTSFLTLETLVNAFFDFGRLGVSLAVFRDRKEFEQKLMGYHRTQEQATCLVGQTKIGGIPLMSFRRIYVAARCLV
jgi:hypothetical protein